MRLVVDLQSGQVTEDNEFVPPEIPAPTQAELRAYANARYTMQMAGGHLVGGVWVSTTDSGRIDMVGAVSLAQIDPNHVFDWVNGAETIQLTSAQVIAIGTAVGQWVQQNYAVLGQVRAGIASEMITATAEIDAADWPSNG